ncbi:hypothetical protein AVEN_14785-1 [Araneus ventricosus]|uniref:Uncharacterized protein n=1 Tax=Araneus ventricosus TaxID=182803 RepID=A0A4Y2FH22_ARAVE|nr:hypothetical protein AVEN_14785-1 [Araneus ventricosus]
MASELEEQPSHRGPLQLLHWKLEIAQVIVGLFLSALVFIRGASLKMEEFGMTLQVLRRFAGTMNIETNYIRTLSIVNCESFCVHQKNPAVFVSNHEPCPQLRTSCSGTVQFANKLTR